MTRTKVYLLAIFLVLSSFVALAQKSTPTYDINTLAGKVASVNGTDGLQIRFSALIEEESDFDPFDFLAPDGATLNDPADGLTVLPPAVTVNVDTNGAAQNETTVAVDPNNPNRLVVGANDYVAGTWSCMISGNPCSLFGDGYSGTYFSNDGGATWCCNSSDPAHIGTLIPGIEHLTGGQYDAGGDPVLAFDSRGNVFYAGLGFNRASAPNTVAVNKGTFDGAGNLSWGAPTFINQTNAPSTLNDKEWIVADSNPNSPFRDRIYLSWTRFLFNPVQGNYVQSPIAFVYSTDGGKTFSTPQLIVGNVLYGQGSRPAVGPDGSVYVFWDGSTRLATFDSIWVTKSTDGGVTFSKPVKVSDLLDVIPIANAAFRDDSFPAAAVAPNGDVYVSWTTLLSDSTGGLCARRTNTNCHSATVYSKSTDGGSHWSAPSLVLPDLDASTRTPVGYPAPDGLTAPAPRRVDTNWPAVGVAPNGTVYIGSYAADTVSPWQTCTTFSPLGSVSCDVTGPYIHNAKLNYYVRNVTAGISTKASTKAINTRYQFRGGFIGDYTALAVGSDSKVHAVWTDTNNAQNISWWFGSHFVPPVLASQQDVVMRTLP